MPEVAMKFVWVKDTRNYSLYQQVEGINKLYLPKGLKHELTIVPLGTDEAK